MALKEIVEKVTEKIVGVFGPDDEAQEEPINSPEEQKLVDMALNDYDYFKSDRQRYEAQWRTEQRFYAGDHWYGLRPADVSQQRPNSVDNVAWSQVESIVSKLCSWAPYPEFEAQEERDEPKAQELNAYMPYEMRCIKFQQKHIRAVRRMVLHGPLIYKTVYDPTVEGGSGMYRYFGQNDIIPVDMASFFPDPRIRDFIDLQKGAAHIFHFRKTLEYFKQRWPNHGHKVQSDMDSDDVNIYDADNSYYSMNNFTADRTPVDGSTDNKTAGLIEYWYRGKPKLMTKRDKELFEELADEFLSEGKDPSEYLAKAEGKMNGVHCLYVSAGGVFIEHKSYVFDHGHYPIVARTLFPAEDNPWGKGYMYDMIKPQIMLNKFAEIAVETNAKMGSPAIMYEEGAIAKPEKIRQRRSEVGALLEVQNLAGIKELQGVNVPNTVFNMMKYYQDMLQKIPGQFDSANGQANPNVKSGQQARELIGAANNRLTIASELIEEALSEVFEQYISNMAQFYADERIGRVTGKKVSISRDRLMNTIPTEYETGNEVPDATGAMVPEVKILQEEYIPKFDIAVKIGVEKPTDRQYWINTAFQLFQTIDPLTRLPMIDAEAVQYTVANGRMEPFDVIDKRMKSEQQIAAKMQKLEQQNAQMQKQLQQMQQQVNQADAAKSQTDMMNAETDRMRAVGDQQLEWAKMEQQGQQNRVNNVMNFTKMSQPANQP